jgi:hypothetical protein
MRQGRYRSGPPPDFRSQPEAPERADQVKFGAIAQLGERFNGIEEVVGSIPSGSTNQLAISDFVSAFSIAMREFRGRPQPPLYRPSD